MHKCQELNLVLVTLCRGSRYNPKTNTWSKQVPMLTRRTRAAAAVLGGHLYVMGGNDGDRALSSGETLSHSQTKLIFHFSR